MRKFAMYVLMVALAIMFANANSAFAQYPIVENPGVQAQADAAQAKADAAAAKKQADDLKKEVDALKKGDWNPTWWVWSLLLFIPAAFITWWFFFRNRGEKQQPIIPEPGPGPAPAPEPPAPAPQPEPPAPAEPENPNPEPEPPAPAPQPEPVAPAPEPADKPPALTEKDKGDLKRNLTAIALVLFVASGVASAAPCTVSSSAGKSRLPMGVRGLDTILTCQVAGAMTVFDPSGRAVATGTKVVNFKPADLGTYHVRVGRVTVTDFYVVPDTYTAGVVELSRKLSVGSVFSADATARTQAKQADVKANAAMSRVATTEKSVGTLSDQIRAIAAAHDQLEQRVVALENRPQAQQVDIAPLQARVAALEAELARVKATANTALSTAQQADTKASDALTRYEEMGLARFKTGLFRSKTVVEAVEDAKAKASKQ